jgi:hypothetical protein
MKTYISLLALLPILAATSLKIIPITIQQTYAEYAQENGTALTKSNSYHQYLTCYDKFGQSGSSYQVSNNIVDLGSIGWDNRFSSCCFNGIWILYQKKDMNGYEHNAYVRSKKAYHADIGRIYIKEYLYPISRVRTYPLFEDIIAYPYPGPKKGY